MRPETPPEGLPPPEYVRAYEANPQNPLKLRAQSLGLVMVSHQRIPSTRRAHETVEFARDHGADVDALQHALLSRYWSLDKDLYSIDILASAVEDVKLDANAFRSAIAAGTYRTVVERKLSEARAIGVSAVPTFIVAERYALQGAQTGDVFEQVLAKL